MFAELITILNIVLSAGLMVLLRQLWQRQQREHQARQQMREDITRLHADLAALCKSSVGAGDHVVKLEHQVNRLLERQTQTEMRTSTERPYSAAIQLVRQGSDAGELVEKCGLTRGEADLIAMLHGVAEAS